MCPDFNFFPRLLLFGLLAGASSIYPRLRADEQLSDYLRPPTLGGVQFWSDVRTLGGWRVQHNLYMGHYRLLDPKNRQHLSGTRQRCDDELNRVAKERKLVPPTGKVVVLLHGLAQNRVSMSRMAQHLRTNAGVETINVEYASTQADLATHAKNLAGIVRGLNQATEIHFVAHSMGNIVVRHFLADCERGTAGVQPVERFGRMVMLGPPNHGAIIAAQTLELPLMRTVLGKSTEQLADFSLVEDQLIAPKFPFGIVTGRANTKIGFNPRIPGDDDGVLTVGTTKLAGAADTMELRCLHTIMIFHPKVLAATQKFLEQGHFVSEEARVPLP